MSYSDDYTPSSRRMASKAEIDSIASAVQDTLGRTGAVLDALNALDQNSGRFVGLVSNRFNEVVLLVFGLGILTLINSVVLGVILYKVW